MADLSGFWRRQAAIATAEYDQKSMLAREMIYDNFNFDPDAPEQIREVINFFANDQRVMMSLIGVLAQVGFLRLAIEDCQPSEEDTDG